MCSADSIGGDVHIVTERFVLRRLAPEDVTERYSRWFDTEAARARITYASRPHAVEDLRRYVAEKLTRPDALLLGIFTRETGEHIGNIKYEPIDRSEGYAVMGILIGEEVWRGRGVATEVLRATVSWLAEHYGIREVLLGVHRDHAAAIRAYEKVGFRPQPSPRLRPDPVRGLCMVWRADQPS